MSATLFMSIEDYNSGNARSEEEFLTELTIESAMSAFTMAVCPAVESLRIFTKIKDPLVKEGLQIAAKGLVNVLAGIGDRTARAYLILDMPGDDRRSYIFDIDQMGFDFKVSLAVDGLAAVIGRATKGIAKGGKTKTPELPDKTKTPELPEEPKTPELPDKTKTPEGSNGKTGKEPEKPKKKTEPETKKKTEPEPEETKPKDTKDEPETKKPEEGKGGTELKAPDTISFDTKQLGKKWGKHKTDYPNMNSYVDYQNYANEVFSKPDKIIYDSINKEYLYIKGNDLLRVGDSGEFISLYPGAQSGRVENAITNGGIIWP